MPSVADLLRNPDFRALPIAEQLKGLSEVDRDFGALPEKEQISALDDPDLKPGKPQKSADLWAPVPAKPWRDKPIADPPTQAPAPTKPLNLWEPVSVNPTTGLPEKASGPLKNPKDPNSGRMPTATEIMSGAADTASLMFESIGQGLFQIGEAGGGAIAALGTAIEQSSDESQGPVDQIGRKWLGGKVREVGEAVSKFISPYAAPPERIAQKAGKSFLEKPELLTDPEYIINLMGSGFGTMAGFLAMPEVNLPALAGAAGPVARVANVVLRHLPAAVAETIIDAGGSFNETRDQLKAQGVSDDEANRKAAEVFARVMVEETPATIALNELGVYGDMFKGGKKIVASTLAEAAQEFGQGVAQKDAKNRVLGTDESVLAGSEVDALGGGLTGLVMSGAEAALGRYARMKRLRQMAAQAPQSVPQEGANTAGDPAGTPAMQPQTPETLSTAPPSASPVDSAPKQQKPAKGSAPAAFVEGSPYDQDDSDPGSVWSTVLEEQSAREAGLQAIDAELETAKGKKRDEIRKRRNAAITEISGAYNEVDNAFGPGWGEEMRRVVAASASPVDTAPTPKGKRTPRADLDPDAVTTRLQDARTALENGTEFDEAKLDDFRAALKDGDRLLGKLGKQAPDSLFSDTHEVNRLLNNPDHRGKGRYELPNFDEESEQVDAPEEIVIRPIDTSARETDPKPGATFTFAADGGEHTVTKVWRTATAKEADGQLNVTVADPNGHEYTYVGRETKEILQHLQPKPVNPLIAARDKKRKEKASKFAVGDQVVYSNGAQMGTVTKYDGGVLTIQNEYPAGGTHIVGDRENGVRKVTPKNPAPEWMKPKQEQAQPPTQERIGDAEIPNAPELEGDIPNVSANDLQDDGRKSEPVEFKADDGTIRLGTVEGVRVTKGGHTLVDLIDEDGNAHTVGSGRIKPKKAPKPAKLADDPKVQEAKDTANKLKQKRAEMDAKAEQPEAVQIPRGSWMNRMDIEQSVQRHAKHPVLGPATRLLDAFKEEVDDHSDGWSSWKLPSHAAAQLMGLIQHPDLATEAAFRKSLAPIRAFYTRHGNAAGMKLVPGLEPEAKPKPEPKPKPTKAEEKQTEKQNKLKEKAAEMELRERLVATKESAVKQMSDRAELEKLIADVDKVYGGTKKTDKDVRTKLSDVRRAAYDRVSDLISESVGGFRYLDTVHWTENGVTYQGEVQGTANAISSRITVGERGDRVQIRKDLFSGPKHPLQDHMGRVWVDPKLLKKGEAPPAVWQLVKLDSLGAYTKHGQPANWGWLRVMSVDGDTLTVRHAPTPLDPAKDEAPFTVTLDELGQRGQMTPQDKRNGDAPKQDDTAAKISAGFLAEIEKRNTALQNAVRSNSTRNVNIELDSFQKYLAEIREVTERVGTPELRAKFAEMVERIQALRNIERGDDPALKVGSWKLVNDILDKLEAGESLGNNITFAKMASDAFGGTISEGKWEPKDAYDALEAAVNQHILENPDKFWYSFPANPNPLDSLRELLAKLPTQTMRSEEQQKFQQFSTPPTIAFVAAKVLNPRNGETVLEPSAGVGGLAIFPAMAGSKVVVNEIAPRRRALLHKIGELSGFAKVTDVDATHLNDLLDQSIKPTAILMNPPFSASGGKVEKNSNEFGFKHLESALDRLAPGGRLVAIMGEGARLEAREIRGKMQGSGAAAFFKRIAAKGNTIQANVGIAGKEYQKYGTTFGIQLIVIDKVAPAADHVPLVAEYNTVEEAWNALGDIATKRTDLANSTGEVRGDQRSEPKPDSRGDRGAKSGGNSGNGVRGPAGTRSGNGRSTTGRSGSGTGNGSTRKSGPADSSKSTPPAPRQLTPEEKHAALQAELDRKAAEADAELQQMLKDLGTQLNTGVPVDAAAKFVEVLARKGAAEIHRGYASFKKFTARLKELQPQLVDFIEKHARDIHDRALEIFEAIQEDFDNRLNSKPPKQDDAPKPPKTEGRNHERVSVKSGPQPAAPVGAEEGEFEPYRPAKLRTGAEHKGSIVESKAMAAIAPPDITYRPHLPQWMIDEGRISSLQFESVIYAGQQHEQFNHDGTRAGFFIGDGTGVGKGREIAAIIYDNWNQGRKKSLWVSVSQDLQVDAERDMSEKEGIGVLDEVPVKNLGEFKYGQPIEHEGVLYLTYHQLIQKSRSGGKETRLDQVMKWLGDDGVIVFDEAHKGKNAVGSEVEHQTDEEIERDTASAERKGVKKIGGATQTGMAMVDLQRKLPKARVVYVSATGATDVRNLGYATRLGLWGPGTQFPDGFRQFLSEISDGGVGAMELIARELKGLGRYLSRSLSFKGVVYREVDHPVNEAQRAAYNAAAAVWDQILSRLDDALIASGHGDTNKQGETKVNKRARAMASKSLWNTNQRFYDQLITAFKVPTVIAEAEKAIDNGDAVVISLIGTGESRAKEQFKKAVEQDLSFDDLDFSPVNTVLGYLDNAFPIWKVEEVQDEHGNKRKVPVKDAQGNPVPSQEALKIREALKADLKKIQLPENPLDQIINYFEGRGIGVAEITGREKKLIADPVTRKPLEVKRVQDKNVSIDDINLHEMARFQNDEARVAIISQAASTGISLHADLKKKNQRKRMHIVAQLSWSADTQMQIFGRTHRSNQKQPPEYVIVSSDIGGEKRFSSTIARRLGTLGALTKGERKAGGGSDVLSKYNFESKYGIGAVALWWEKLRNYNAENDESIPEIIRKLGAGTVVEKLGLGGDAPTGEKAVSSFLNRILNQPIAVQNAAFNLFTTLFDGLVERDKANGKFDDGTQDIVANSVEIEQEQIVREDPKGNNTIRYELDADIPVEPNSFEDAKRFVYGADKENGVYRHKETGEMVAARPSTPETNPKTGELVPMVTFMRLQQKKFGRRQAEKFGAEFEPVYLVNGSTFADMLRAKEEWEKQAEALPGSEHKKLNLIGGAVLPIWRQLMKKSDKGLKITRVTTADGKRIVGVELSKKLADSLTGTHATTPEGVFGRVWEDGDVVPLSGNIQIQRKNVWGTPMFTLSAPTNAASQRSLAAMGIDQQTYGYDKLFYLPMERSEEEWKLTAAGMQKLREVLQQYPIAEQQQSPTSGNVYMGSGLGALQPFLEAGFERVKSAVKSDEAKGAVDFFRPVISRIRDQGKFGGKLADMIERAADKGEVAAGKRIALLVDAEMEKLTREERFNLVDVLEGKAAAKSQKIADVAQVVRAITNDIGAEAQQLGVLVKRKQTLMPSDPIPKGVKLNPLEAKARAMGRVITVEVRMPFQQRSNYFPHRIPDTDRMKAGKLRADILANLVRRGIRANEADAARFLDDYIAWMEKDEGGRVNSLMTWMVRSKQAPNLQAAWDILQKMRQQAQKNRSGSLEHSRAVDLPFWDPDPGRVLPQWISYQSMRLKQVEEFGQDNQRIKRAIRGIAKNHGDHAFVRKMVERILGEIDDAATQNEKLSLALRTLNGFKLGLAGIANSTQGALNTFLKADGRAVLAGFRGMVTKDGRRLGTESGAAVESVLGEVLRNAGDDGRALGTYLKLTGFAFTERMNRIFAANAGANYARRNLNKLRLKPNDAGARAALAELGIDGLAAAKRGGLTPDEVLLAAKRFSDLTQFRTRPQDVPEFASTPMGKVFFQFKGFIYGQTRLIHREVVGELKERRYGRGLRALLVLGTVFPVTGVLVNALRNMLTGGGDDDESTIWKWLEGAFQVGAAGVLGDLIEAAVRRRGDDLILGPTFGTIGQTINAAGAKDKAHAFGRLVLRHVPIVGQIKWLRDFFIPPKRTSGGGRSGVEELLGAA